MTAGPRGIDTLRTITAAEKVRPYGINHVYVDSLLSGLATDVQAKARRALHSSGYLGGPDSASARADSSFNW